MENVLNEKRRRVKKRVALFGFLVVFGALIWFGYLNFIRPGKRAASSITNDSTGLTLRLPEAAKDQEKSKLELYVEAERDSIARHQALENDPNTRRFRIADEAAEKGRILPSPFHTSVRPGGLQLPAQKRSSPAEDELELKMKQLNRLINQTSQPKEGIPDALVPEGLVPLSDQKPAGSPVAKESQVDPELLKLDGMLDKLKQLQQPAAELASTSKSVMVKKKNHRAMSWLFRLLHRNTPYWPLSIAHRS